MRRENGRGFGRWVLPLLAALLILASSARARAEGADVADAKRWQLGQPAPTGYHVARKHTWGIVGGSLLAGGYVLSASTALALSVGCYVPGADHDDGGGCHDPESDVAPLLLIPVAGPFLALTNRDVQHDGGAIFWFSFFGAVQVAGAALLTYDIAVPHYGLKRGEGPASASSAEPRLLVAPTLVGRGPGLAVLGRF